VEDWLTAKGHDKVAKEVKKRLPGVFTKIIGDVSTIEKATDKNSDPEKTISTEKQNLESCKMAAAHSLSPNNLEAGVRRLVIANVKAPEMLEKTANDNGKYEELAKAYAVHQLQWIKAAAKDESQVSSYCRAVAAYNVLA
jgi:hypothetical protein